MGKGSDETILKLKMLINQALHGKTGVRVFLLQLDLENNFYIV